VQQIREDAVISQIPLVITIPLDGQLINQLKN